MVHTTTVIKLNEKATRFSYGQVQGVPVLAIKEEEHTYPSGYSSKGSNELEELIENDIIIKFGSKEMIDNMIMTLELLKKKI